MLHSPIRTALAVALATLVIGEQSLTLAEEIATVFGKVSVNGRPLAEGKIVLHAAGAKRIEIPIKDGAYSADRVPPGPKTVTIEGTDVPAKYSSRETTELTAELKVGANEVVFELKS